MKNGPCQAYGDQIAEDDSKRRVLQADNEREEGSDSDVRPLGRVQLEDTQH